MRRIAVALVLCFVTAREMSLRAQQQTGAPAGVPVPAPSAEPQHVQAGQQLPTSAVFRVHVLDGRNGDPLRNAHLTLWYDEQEGAGTLLTTDQHGDASMPAPIGQPQRVLVRLTDLVDCRTGGTRDVPAGFNLQSIAQHGESAGNHCGPVGRHPAPGELVVFARPSRWYEGINQGGATR